MQIFCVLLSWWSALCKCFEHINTAAVAKCEQFPQLLGGAGRLLFYMLLTYWVLFSDPFGLSSAADRALSNQLGRFRAYLQPVAPAPVTVVAIDYPSIAGLNNDAKGWMEANDWPLTYADHGRILRDLALPTEGEAAPAAIFYDIFFERPRTTSGDLERLGRMLDRLGANPAASRVYLAGGGKFVPMSAQSLAQLQSASLAVSAWEGAGELYPLQAPLGGAAGDEPVPTAATALYQELCRARGDDCHWIDATSQPNLAIQWSITARANCPAGLQSSWRDVLVIFSRLIGTSAAVQNPPAQCMPVHQVRLSQLYGEHPVSLRPPHLKPGEPFVVLVGNVMPSLNDYVSSPLYGQVAGVYLHANALVNLTEKGRNYTREVIAKELTLFCLLLAVVFWMWWRYSTQHSNAQKQNTVESKSGSLVLKVLNALALTLLSMLLVTMSFYLCYQLGVAPEGWMSLAAFIPFLWQTVAATEPNYCKDVPNEKALPDPSALTD